MKIKHETINTYVATAAMVIALFALVLQYLERYENINYELGGERVDADHYDQYFRIYNRSSSDIRLESVILKADMGDGIYRKLSLYEPQTPEPLASGQFKEFRFRFQNQTAKDDAAEKSAEYSTYTERSTVEVITTKGTRLTFESGYHPYVLDRIYRSLDRGSIAKKTFVSVQ